MKMMFHIRYIGRKEVNEYNKFRSYHLIAGRVDTVAGRGMVGGGGGESGVERKLGNNNR